MISTQIKRSRSSGSLWIKNEYILTPYSCLENPVDRGAWWAAVHGVPKSRTRLSDFTFTFHFHALEKEMATHSSVLAWRIPGTEKSGGLLSMGSHRVGHDWSDLATAAAGMIFDLTRSYQGNVFTQLCMTSTGTYLPKEHICICPVLNYIHSNETKFTVIVWSTLLTIRLHYFHFNVKCIKFHMKINNILYNKY